MAKRKPIKKLGLFSRAYFYGFGAAMHASRLYAKKLWKVEPKAGEYERFYLSERERMKKRRKQ